MNRKRLWIAGGIVSGLLIWIALMAALFVLVVRPRLWPGAQEQTGAVGALTDCSTDSSTVCVSSFTSQPDGSMRIDVQVPRPVYPRFYLFVQYAGSDGERYECEPAGEAGGRVSCTGARLPLGEVIAIEARSASTDHALVRGVLRVNAMALPTPGSVTATPEPTATESPDADGDPSF